ncbi:MAG: type II secretion system protein [Candidatus Omnitrophica bacterium]|nr:type II secretion system protein [Candidatus Omnitrophota bacterium]
MSIKKTAAFTIIELITVMVIIAIVSVVSVGIIAHFMRHSIYLPDQMNVVQVADTAMDLIIEGDDRARGLRFAWPIISVAPNDITFINSDKHQVRYRILNNKLTRTIDSGAEEAIPYYTGSGINVAGQNNALFNFYNGLDAATTDASQVQRIGIDLSVTSGAGSINNWEGAIMLASSVKIFRFNQSPYFTAVPSASPAMIPRRGRSTITFSVNDGDGGRVSWAAAATTGSLSRTSGSSNVPYNVVLTYTASNRTGIVTITVDLDDGSGGTASGAVDIYVYR